MNFLAAVAAQLLQWLISKGYAAVSALIAKLQKRAAIEKAAEESVKPLQEAKSGEEIDKAADDALRKF